MADCKDKAEPEQVRREVPSDQMCNRLCLHYSDCLGCGFPLGVGILGCKEASDLTEEMEIAKNGPMKLKAWEPIISQIVEEARQEPSESGKQKTLLAWRAKLEKEPTSLQPYQIDEIVREVRSRLSSVSS